MFRLWCEYEYGQEDLIFTSEEKGIEWFNAAVIEVEGKYWKRLVANETDDSPYDAFDCAGLVGFNEVTVI
jgi:hypothetical protein